MPKQWPITNDKKIGHWNLMFGWSLVIGYLVIYKNMLINFQKLIKLPVFTESGVKLGKICDIKIDVESHVILEYLVKPFLSVANSYIIKPSQIESITSETVVVYDAVVKNRKVKEIKMSSSPEIAGNTMSARDAIE